MDVRFEATDGTDLEGVLHEPDGSRRGVAVVCHPHPQFGGSMDTWMPPVLQRALTDDGWVTLRFNFRGVGLSEGSFDGGRGEVEDVVGAIGFLLEHVGDAAAPVFLTGWSFGALTSLAAALQDQRVAGWAGVAPPVGMLDQDGERDVPLPHLDRDALAGWSRPSLWIIGSRDQFTSVDQLERVAADAGEHARVEVLDGDHFLLGRGDDLGGLVAEQARRVSGG